MEGGSPSSIHSLESPGKSTSSKYKKRGRKQDASLVPSVRFSYFATVYVSSSDSSITFAIFFEFS